MYCILCGRWLVYCIRSMEHTYVRRMGGGVFILTTKAILNMEWSLKNGKLKISFCLAIPFKYGLWRRGDDICRYTNNSREKGWNGIPKGAMGLGARGGGGGCITYQQLLAIQTDMLTVNIHSILHNTITYILPNDLIRCSKQLCYASVPTMDGWGRVHKVLLLKYIFANHLLVWGKRNHTAYRSHPRPDPP